MLNNETRLGFCVHIVMSRKVNSSSDLFFAYRGLKMLNINEGMWRDSATTASMAKPNAWGNPDMAITRRAAQFNSSENLENPGSATTPVSSSEARLKFMFSQTPEDMAETVLFSGGAPKIAGLEDAMERLSMVSIIVVIISRVHDA